MVDPDTYLDANFDPNKITIVELIRILGAHDAPIPPTRAKKEVYVNLFKEHIAANRKKIIKEREEVLKRGKVTPVHSVVGKPLKRTKSKNSSKNNSNGSIDGLEKERNEEPVFSDDNPFQSGNEATPIPMKKEKSKRKVKKKSSKTSHIDTDDDDIDGGTDHHGSNGDRYNENENEQQRISSSAPQPFLFKMRSPDAKAIESPFSDWSPELTSPTRHITTKKSSSSSLQSKESLIATDSDNGAPATLYSSPTRSPKSKSKSPEKMTPVLSSSSSSISPDTSKFTSTLGHEDNKHIEGEEFQQSPPPMISLSSLKRSGMTFRPPGSKSQQRVRFKDHEELKSTQELSIGFLILFISSIAILLHWYYILGGIEGYCQPNQPSLRSNYSGYNPLGHLIPPCIPCPPHALCKDKSIIGCQSDMYMIQDNILTKFIPSDYLPFPLDQPICVLDTRKQKREEIKRRVVETMIDRLDEVVAEWSGKVECGQIKGIDYNSQEYHGRPGDGISTKLGMNLTEAKEIVKEQMHGHAASAKFDEYFNLVLDRISIPDSTPLSLIYLPNNSNPHRIITSTPPILSLSCRFRKWLFRTLRARWMEMFGLSFFIILFTSFLSSRSRRKQESESSSTLARVILGLLQEQEEAHRMDPSRHPVSAMSVAQLRDYYLPSHPSTDGMYIRNGTVRDRVWKGVEKLVLKNASVRETTMELRGDHHLVWQWVGEPLLSPRRRVSGLGSRVSNKGGWSSGDDDMTSGNESEDIKLKSEGYPFSHNNFKNNNPDTNNSGRGSLYPSF